MKNVINYPRCLLVAALLMLSLCKMRGEALKVTINMNDFTVVSEAFVEDERALYGIQPGNIAIDAVLKDSTNHRIFESIGCACYDMNQSYLSFEFTAYSDIDILYTTFCAIEDQEPIRPEWCSIKQCIAFDKNGLRGSVAIINYENQLEELKHKMGQYYVPLPEMNSVLENIQGEYYYPYPDVFGLLITGYLCKGVPVKDILAFMEDFKKALSDNGIKPDSQCGFNQDYSIYKFVLEHQGKELHIDELEEYAKIAYRLNEFYGNNQHHNDTSNHGSNLP